MTTLAKIISSLAVAFGIVVLSSAAFAQDRGDHKTAESSVSVIAQPASDVRFTAIEPDSEGCHKAVYGKKSQRYHLYRDRFLIAETRWLYCVGRIDHLPAWAR